MFNKKNNADEAVEISGSSLNKLGKGTFFEGKLRSEGDLRIDGEFKGEMETNARIVLGATGQVNGNIKCKNAEISGKVVGNLDVSEMLILRATSNIQGDIFVNKLVIEDGARLNGNCRMGTNATGTNTLKQ